jgi:hypothetical protein
MDVTNNMLLIFAVILLGIRLPDFFARQKMPLAEKLTFVLMAFTLMGLAWLGMQTLGLMI